MDEDYLTEERRYELHHTYTERSEGEEGDS